MRLVSEVIAVDDGSSDSSQQLLQTIAKSVKKLRILESDGRNRGAHARLNQLVDAATNDWVSILNTDDLFVSGRFEALSSMIKRDVGDLFFGNLILIDENGKRLGARNALLDNEVEFSDSWDLNELLERKMLAPLLLQQNIAATTSNMVFSKKLHRNVGGFRPYRYCHDWDFMLRASLADRVVFSPAMLTKYRLHPGNTIKEARFKVVSDVRRMFAGLRRDLPDVMRTEGTLSILAQNRYLSGDGHRLIHVVAASAVAVDYLRLALSHAGLPFDVQLVGSETHRDVEYVFYVSQAACERMAPGDLESIFLALDLRRYDAMIVGWPAGGSASVGADDIVTAHVCRAGTNATDWTTIRVLGLRGLNSQRVLDLLDLPALASVDLGRTVGARGPAPQTRPTLRGSVVLEAKTKPIVFILPAMLAIGGVERLILDTINGLKDKYEFMVVNTEPLTPGQGSMHAQFGDTRIFDLSEVAREEDYIFALEQLRSWYEPDLVWICNGAPWQVEHAKQIRDVFADVPIIDHMAYDHEKGWIAHYDSPGVRRSDRFIAVNQKILATMIDKFAIPRAKIDLIYHGTDLKRFAGAASRLVTRAARKSALGLDESRLLFGMIGRLDAQKRPFDMIELAKLAPDDMFIWVGLGELEQEFVRRSADVKNIRLLPARPDLVPIYQALDALVILSEYEALPLVLLEALASGVPILSSDVGAIDEVLTRLEAGSVFWPPGDLNAIGAAFRAFKASLESMQKKANRVSVSAIQEFSTDRMIAEYDICFQKAISERQEPVW